MTSPAPPWQVLSIVSPSAPASKHRQPSAVRNSTSIAIGSDTDALVYLVEQGMR